RERTAPWFTGRAARILARLRIAPVVGEVRVEIAVEAQLAFADLRLQSEKSPVLAQALELLVRVEDERGPREAPRRARRARCSPTTKNAVPATLKEKRGSSGSSLT